MKGQSIHVAIIRKNEYNLTTRKNQVHGKDYEERIKFTIQKKDGRTDNE